MENVLITGGLGYIGTNLVEKLRKIGINCIIVDLSNKKWYEYKRVEKLNHLHGVHGVVHLAAISGIANCSENTEEAIMSNITASYNIFDMCNKYCVPCVFTSSQAAKTPLANFYATTKYIAEVEAMRVNKEGADIKIFRLANVYGGINYLETKNTVVAKFVNAYKNNEKLIINGRGEQIRDFIHVDDVCDAIIKALTCNNKIIDPIDIGTGIPTSVLDLAKMFGSSFTFDSKSDKVGTLRNVADITKTSEILGFESKWKIEDYIENFKG